jgi:hypothetical protein
MTSEFKIAQILVLQTSTGQYLNNYLEPSATRFVFAFDDYVINSSDTLVGRYQIMSDNTAQLTTLNSALSYPNYISDLISQSIIRVIGDQMCMNKVLLHVKTNRVMEEGVVPIQIIQQDEVILAQSSNFATNTFTFSVYAGYPLQVAMLFPSENTDIYKMAYKDIPYISDGIEVETTIKFAIIIKLNGSTQGKNVSNQQGESYYSTHVFFNLPINPNSFGESVPYRYYRDANGAYIQNTVNTYFDVVLLNHTLFISHGSRGSRDLVYTPSITELNYLKSVNQYECIQTKAT